MVHENSRVIVSDELVVFRRVSCSIKRLLAGGLITQREVEFPTNRTRLKSALSSCCLNVGSIYAQKKGERKGKERGKSTSMT